MTRLYVFLALLFVCFEVSSQVLKGQLTDIAGNPVPFARVHVQQTGYGTVANAMGNFQLELEFKRYAITCSAPGYMERTDSVHITDDVTIVRVILEDEAEMLPEAVITARMKRDLGKEIMKKVIDKRPYFRELLSEYSCNTYCFASLEKEQKDTLEVDTVPARKKMNITEWNGTSYYKAANRYKDVVAAFTDLSEGQSGSSVTIVTGSFEDDYLEPTTFTTTNPYLFVNGIRDADINLFDNLIEAPGLSQRPLISPMAYNAFVYYSFAVAGSFYDDNLRKIYEIRVHPRFREEALFEGSLYIRDSSWELVSYELGVNKGAMDLFQEMRLICDFEKNGERIVPTRREFVYLLKDGRRMIHGNVRLKHSDYVFSVDDSERAFWLETTVYTPEAFTRDSAYWETIRPFHLKKEELQFIADQDSIARHHASEQYLREQDSIYNTLNVWDFLFNGVGFRNTFKKQELYVGGLIEQVVPFGVGGYRHRLSVEYQKGFGNNHELELSPVIDYGFKNNDLKGSLGVGYLYNPRRFSKIFFEAGDVYDFMNGYQSIQGTFAPANRVRNRKFELYHRLELVNGLYFKSGIFYSNRQSIEGIEYPSWVDAFGFFSKPEPFEGYKVFMTDLEFSYHFRQKYMLKGNQKVIFGSQWPVLSLQYKKGWPKAFGGQSDFDFLELRLTDEIHLNSLGNSEYRLVSGAFVRKNNLRLVEHKFFRTSDKWFFSNPVNSLQLLDTALNTSNSYLQFNAIHHFNGFFLNKIWMLNRLKLQETAGGSLLLIPDAHFAQAELYVGLERTFRIRKQLFKIGAYAVSSGSSFDKADISFKFGINFYNSFKKKWDY